MNKELEAWKEIKCFCYKEGKLDKQFDIIETALKDFEWLKSILSIDFFDKLPTDDKIKLLGILGVEIK